MRDCVFLMTLRSHFFMVLSLTVSQAWSLNQVDVSNAFLYDDLEDDVFIEQPPGYVAQGESSKVCFLRPAQVESTCLVFQV